MRLVTFKTGMPRSESFSTFLPASVLAADERIATPGGGVGKIEPVIPSGRIARRMGLVGGKGGVEAGVPRIEFDSRRGKEGPDLGPGRPDMYTVSLFLWAEGMGGRTSSSSS